MHLRIFEVRLFRKQLSMTATKVSSNISKTLNLKDQYIFYEPHIEQK